MKQFTPFAPVFTITGFLIIFAIALVLNSCTKAGEVTNSPVTVKIYGKEYIFKGVIVQNDTKPVWIMIPVDSTVPQPLTISQEIKVGKTTEQQSIIIIK